jgi:tungstate transport system ATP-binding protein
MAESARLLPIIARGLAIALDGRAVLVDASFEIASAGITAVIGPNGAGKSTLLRVLDGLIAADRGRVDFGARRVDACRRAFVFQKTALVRASVAYNVGLGLLPLGLDAGERRARIAAALARVGLADRAADPARRLSGGEQQRIALARAWAIEPELLLLDEPTASLDPAASEAVEGLIAAIAAGGTKVILVSHNLGQVARLAEDVLVLAGGTVVEHGPTAQILQRPTSAAARAYLKGEMPWLSFAAGS